jgi:hypothetical protein
VASRLGDVLAIEEPAQIPQSRESHQALGVQGRADDLAGHQNRCRGLERYWGWSVTMNAAQPPQASDGISEAIREIATRVDYPKPHSAPAGEGARPRQSNSSVIACPSAGSPSDSSRTRPAHSRFSAHGVEHDCSSSMHGDYSQCSRASRPSGAEIASHVPPLPVPKHSEPPRFRRRGPAFDRRRHAIFRSTSGIEVWGALGKV